MGQLALRGGGRVTKKVSHKYTDNGGTRKLTKYIRTFLGFDLGQSSTLRDRNSIGRTVPTDAATPKNPSVSSRSPTPPPLHTILSELPATHARFFDMLGAELDKVETFYAEREKEMHERAKRLREQLNELGIHRQMFHVSALYCDWEHMPLNCDPLAIICAIEDPELDPEGASFCLICAFVTDPVVPWPYHEARTFLSSWRERYNGF
ncbi:hypothetical protein J3R83DRAFT_9701 [Lanmaoa asiatica]|nr:hypothetical protein J3R83DRAFT_9701 [Lanmaoa asiatica]